MTDNGRIFDIMSRIVLEGQWKISFYREMSNALLLECILMLYRMVQQTSIPVFEVCGMDRLRGTGNLWGLQ
jgi:hypothetical protein